MKNYDLVKQFALALDKEDYAVLKNILAYNCVYILKGEILKGKKNIIDSYRNSGTWAKENLDSVTYTSEVTEINNDLFEILFNDFITHKNKTFTYQSIQRVTIEDNKIVKIENHEIPGKKEELHKFFKEFNITNN